MSKCSRCGKDMTDAQGNTLEGIRLELLTTAPFENTNLPSVCVSMPNNYELMKRQAGKYGINMAYVFCWECWLDSLFVRPLYGPMLYQVILNKLRRNNAI